MLPRDEGLGGGKVRPSHVPSLFYQTSATLRTERVSRLPAVTQEGEFDWVIIKLYNTCI